MRQMRFYAARMQQGGRIGYAREYQGDVWLRGVCDGEEASIAAGQASSALLQGEMEVVGGCSAHAA